MTMTEKQQPQVSKRDLKKRKERLETPQQTSQEYYQYRALSAGAVLSLALSAVSLPSVFLATANPFLLILPLIGVCFAGTTVRSLRRRQDEYIGLGYARIALATSALTFGIGTCWAIYTYATEVPEGYQRISFSDLQPVPAHKEIPFSPQAAELPEQSVCEGLRLSGRPVGQHQAVRVGAGHGHLLFRRPTETHRHDPSHARGSTAHEVLVHASQFCWHLSRGSRCLK